MCLSVTGHTQLRIGGTECMIWPIRLLGLQAVDRAAHPEHRVCPYLLRVLAMARLGQVWCADMTYIPVQYGFLYLVAALDLPASVTKGSDSLIFGLGHRRGAL